MATTHQCGLEWTVGVSISINDIYKKVWIHKKERLNSGSLILRTRKIITFYPQKTDANLKVKVKVEIGMLLVEISDSLPNVIRGIEKEPINNPNSFIIESIRTLFFAFKTRPSIDSASSALKEIIEYFDSMVDFNKNSK